jgi:hypothetical protein
MPVSPTSSVEDSLPVTSFRDEERWLIAEQIATSTTFARSPRLSQLLLYLCEQALLGHTAQLTEQNIAAEFFGRKGRFDPAADTIVRSHVLRLRQKLDVYFQEEGLHTRQRISIPKGGYVPAFEDIPEEIAAPMPDQPLAPPDNVSGESSVDLSKSQHIHRRLFTACVALSVACTLLLASWIVNRPPWQRGSIFDQSPRHQLWKQLFTPRMGTMLVAADSGLVMLHGITQQNSTLSEYLGRNFSKETASITTMRPEVALSIADRRYTSFVDLEFFDRMTHVPEALSRSYAIRYARDISINDLKSSNVVLSGSQDANPWIEVFEPQMNFVLQNDLLHNVRAFANRKPQAGESSLYRCDQFEYGVLAFLPNLSNTGNVLIAEGTSVAGTEAISDFLFANSTLDTFLRKIAKPNGTIPHFEVLMQSGNLNGSASRSQVVAYRTY